MDDILWAGPALFAGILASRIGLPPMVGYLLAGFVLNFSGIYDHERLTLIGNLGVTLLLFTIGLKLDVRSLLRPVIWAGTTLHTLIVVALFGTGIYWLSLTGLSVFSGVDFKIAILIGFALSFSSTVFAVKTLEDKGEYLSRYGQIAIGVLIMQDVFAVLFLAASTGKLPQIWALALVLLIPLRIALLRLMDSASHGELQILLGLALAFGSYALFEAVDIKGDLGALVVGAMIASHPLAGKISKKLLGFKDLLLVGFFLSIGMSGVLSVSAVLIALGLAVLVAFKVVLFFLVFTRFRMRARASTLASLTLANYSEFGLIVGAIAVANGWLSDDWLVIIALALTMTIIAAAPVNKLASGLFQSMAQFARKFETQAQLPEDAAIDLGSAKIAVIGMGRLGTSVYDTLKREYGDVLVGIDIDTDNVAMHEAAGRNMLAADITDDELWDRALSNNIETTVLAMHEYAENHCGVLKIRRRSNQVQIIAVAGHDEGIDALKDAGANAVWDLYSEAGVGFAEKVISYRNIEKS